MIGYQGWRILGNSGLVEFFAKIGLSKPRSRPSQGESLREAD